MLIKLVSVSATNDLETLNKSVLDVIKLIQSFGNSYADAPSSKKSRVNTKLKALGLDISKLYNRGNGRLFEITARNDSHGTFLAFHVAEEVDPEYEALSPDPLNYVVHYDLNSGTVFTVKNIGEGKMYHEGGPRRVTPGTEKKVKNADDFSKLISANIKFEFPINVGR